MTDKPSPKIKYISTIMVLMVTYTYRFIPAMQCDSLGIDNSDLVVSGGYYGDSFEGACDLGYVLSSDGGNTFLVTCGEGLLWNSTFIQCQRKSNTAP